MKKNLSKKIALLVGLIAFVFTPSLSLFSSSQEETVEEIIIERNGKEYKENIHLEISDDDILVNGKPLEEYITVGLKLKRKKKHRKNNKARCRGGCMHSRKAYLGVLSNTLENDKGALLKEVTPHTAAAEAGLQRGDIILKLDDKRITQKNNLGKVVKSFDIASTVAITYLRNGKEKTTKATLREWHPQNHLESDLGNIRFRDFIEGEIYDRIPTEKVPGPKIGLSVESRESEQGLKVSDVAQGSAAEKAGIKKDDIITKIGGVEVNTIRFFAQKIRKQKISKEPLEFSIQRGSSTKAITLKIPRPIRKATF